MSSLGIGEAMDVATAEATKEVVRRFKQHLLPFCHVHPTPETRAKMKRVIMQFIWKLQRTEELPVRHPYMRVADVVVGLDECDPRHIKLRFTDERGEVVVLSI